MNHYMNKVTLTTFSFFGTGNRPSEDIEPERFYHGFVLGLLADANLEYVITSKKIMMLHWWLEESSRNESGIMDSRFKERRS